MERLAVPRLILSGLTPRVGKSLIMLGLATELKQKGISASYCVVGPNFQQASLIRGISDRSVHVLDPTIQTQSQILESLYMASLGADIILIEGAGTLLEEIEDSEFAGGPDSFIAKLTYSPICPIFDGSIEEDDLLKLLERHINLLPEIDIGAGIATRLPANQDELLKAVARINNLFVANKHQPLIGVIPTIAQPEELPAHGIHQNRRTLPISRQFLMELSSIVARCVDVDEIMSSASKAQQIVLEDYRYLPSPRSCKIAVSFDNAFGLCYQDNLSYMRLYGADLVSFSPLADVNLPRGIGGVYFTGAFLQDYGTDLMKNTAMIRSLRTFHEQGGAIYAEGSGAAYLCREFMMEDGKTKIPGVGIIPATAVIGDKQEWTFKGSLLEDSVLGDRDLTISGISTGEWQIRSPERMIRCLRMIKPGVGTVIEGFSPTGQVFATFSFLHWGTNPQFARNFVSASSVIKSSNF